MSKDIRNVLRTSKAFTLLEVLIGVAILSVLAGITIPIYTQYKVKLDTAIAVKDIINIQVSIESYLMANDANPNSLIDVNMDHLVDAWGNPYQYLDLASSPPGFARKDHALVPINSDYDLYSMGPDGQSMAPLTAAKSRDDIVRANNGSFIGLASDY